MINHVIAVLRHLRWEFTAEDVVDILWLAQYQPASAPRVAEERAGGPFSNTRVPPTPPLRTAEEGTAPTLATDTQAAALPPLSTSEPSSSSRSAPQLTEARTFAYPKHRVHTISPKTGLDALPFSSPAAPALPEKPNLRRALRPFMRRVPSRTQHVLDEEATVQNTADAGGKGWLLIQRPALTRWLDIALVVDTGSSMVLWRQTIAELRRLLEQQGAFRRVQTWSLSTDTITSPLCLHIGMEWGSLRRPVRAPHELVDPSGRRLVMVVSDCVSPAWRRGDVARMLSTWARHNIVVLVQMLPQRFWPRSALEQAVPISLRARLPGTPNAQLEKKVLRVTADPKRPSGCPVPIVTLEPYTIALWAQGIFGLGGEWMPGMILPAASPQSTAVVHRSAEPLAPEERVQLFHAVASPTAWRLAGYLAAVPLTVPIMHLVQRAMLPASKQVHLAEVFLSGLIKDQSPSETRRHPDHVEYDFVDGVREILWSTMRISETIDVLIEVSKFIDRYLTHPLHFPAWLANPGATGNLIIEANSRPFATVAANVLQRIGGEYAKLAAALQRSLLSAATELATAQTPGGTQKISRDVTVGEQRFQKGLEIRELLAGGSRQISSDSPVAYELVPDMYRIITELLYGSIWSRPGLDIKYRVMATLTVAAIQLTTPQVRAQVRNALNVGITPEEIIEICMMIAFYGRIPAAYNALAVTREVFEERGMHVTLPETFDPTVAPDSLYERGTAKHQELMPDVFGYYPTEPTQVEFELDILMQEYFWGAIWTRPGLDMKSRIVCTLAYMVVEGQFGLSVRRMIEGALHCGLTKQEIMEIGMQLVFYVGIGPARTFMQVANTAFRSPEFAQ